MGVVEPENRQYIPVTVRRDVQPERLLDYRGCIQIRARLAGDFCSEPLSHACCMALLTTPLIG